MAFSPSSVDSIFSKQYYQPFRRKLLRKNVIYTAETVTDNVVYM